MVYNIYAGLGRFGGAEFYSSEDFSSEEDAVEYARDVAIQEYQSYEGYHGIYGLQDIREEYQDFGLDDDFTDEDLEEVYLEEIESCIEYYVEPAIEVKWNEWNSLC